jgi:hypothetical protein
MLERPKNQSGITGKQILAPESLLGEIYMQSSVHEK